MLIFKARHGRSGTFCIQHYDNNTNETVWTDDMAFEDFCNDDGYVMVQVRWNVCEVLDRANFNEFVEEGW